MIDGGCDDGKNDGVRLGVFSWQRSSSMDGVI